MAYRKKQVYLKQWPTDGPPLVWKATGAGTGYSSLAITGGRIYTMGVRGTANMCWRSTSTPERKFGPPQTATGIETVVATVPVEHRLLMAIVCSHWVVTAIFPVIETKTGRVVWTMNILQKFGGNNPNWGISESPLVMGEKLLVNAGGPDASVIALNKKDGSLIWKSQSDAAGYSSAMPVQIGSTTQVVFFTDQRALGVDLKDGRLLWDYQEGIERCCERCDPGCERQSRLCFIRLRNRRSIS